MEKIVMLPIERLHPHPDNPRKNLGDLEELAASIKANGIFQNLTVVPFSMTDEEYNKACEDYRANPTPEGQRLLNSVANGAEKHYTVIIGHRRLAAAQAAGLSEVPCAVVEMTEQEQLQTMLTENMQRTDLTIVERAEGMQMVLDLGVSVADLAKDTGFSESTIRRRVKLLDLDRKELEAAEGRGGTIKDYLELDKIDDPKEKNKVLQKIGTYDFNYALREAIERQNTIKDIDEAEKVISEKATLVDEEPEDTCFEFHISRWSSSIDFDPDFEYCYTVSGEGIDRRISVYSYDEDDDSELKPETKPAEDTMNTIMIQYVEEKNEEFNALLSRMYDLRLNFIKEYPNTRVGSHILKIIPRINEILSERYVSGIYWEAFQALDVTVNGESVWSKAPDSEQLQSRMKEIPEKVMLVLTWGRMDKRDIGYDFIDFLSATKEINIWTNEIPDKELKRTYEFLKDLGYEISTEERELLSGEYFNRIYSEAKALFGANATVNIVDEEEDGYE